MLIGWRETNALGIQLKLINQGKYNKHYVTGYNGKKKPSNKYIVRHDQKK